MHATAVRIRELLERDLPELQHVLNEAEAVISDLEYGLRETPVSVAREFRPGASQEITIDNRAPLSPLPAPARQYHMPRLRLVWDPLFRRLNRHLDIERRVLYPLALAALDGNADKRRLLSTPIVQMVSEHEQLRASMPRLRQAALTYGPVRRHIERVPTAFERHTRIEEIELFPALLQLADGDFDVTNTPLQARYRTGKDLGRSLRKSAAPAAKRRKGPPRDPASLLVKTLKSWLG